MLDRLLQSQLLSDLVNAVAHPQGVAAYAVCDGAKPALAAALAQKTGRPVLYIAPGDREAARVAEDVNQYLPQSAASLRPRERQFIRAAASHESEWQRLSALEGLRAGDIRVLCVAADALLWRMTPPSLVDEMTISLKTGDVIAPADLMVRLSEAGYERVDMVEGRGQCALRGAIVDVYPPAAPDALRIEFFGDEIDGMRAFDCISQRSLRPMDTVRIPPAGEYLLKADNRPAAGARMRALLEGALRRLQAARPQDQIIHAALEAEELESEFSSESREGLRKLLREAERLEEGGLCRPIDLWASLLLPQTAPLISYLDHPIVLVDTPDRCGVRIKDAADSYLNDLSLAVERMEAIQEQQTLLYTPDEALALINGCDMLSVQEFLRGCAGFKQGNPLKMDIMPAPQYHGSIRDLANDIAAWRRENAQVWLLSGGEARGERLLDTLRGVDAALDDQVRLLPLSLSHGFSWAELGLHILSDTDIYGAARKKARSQQTAGQRIDAFTDLKEGDYVVHEMHGVGVYMGVTRIQTEGAWRDYLLIQYKGSDKLYVPTDQFDRVQKYIGSTEAPPPVNSLSGGEWQKQKSRVKAGLKKLAFNLVQLYAARESTPGYAFSPDNGWTAQFNDGVPYELTPDQAHAVEDIKRDMESPRNMDRLLCGDVGYGKTEVALRAAFKAVSDGKQVALLAPTTILAQQHYYTCKKRFQDFPVNIDVVSRFRTAKNQREALMNAAAGKTDILIGTHRLLSKDVKFKDLGLLIIDEEQRFGVAHKEQIKNMKKTVDVLTLSATPIPRTLHMGMVGVRDMSLLETPPEERIPVQT